MAFWVALEVAAVLVCGIGALRWRSAPAGGQATEQTARFKRQAIGGGIFVMLILLRLLTHSY
jgi:hypothetical protein